MRSSFRMLEPVAVLLFAALSAGAGGEAADASNADI